MHNIDTNQTWCSFELTEAEIAKLRARMSLLGHADAVGKTIRSPGVAWWPKVLEGTLDQSALDQAGMNLYSSGPLLFAFQGGTGRGFMYRESAR